MPKKESDEKIAELEVKFEDIKGLRDKIIGESTEIGNTLKNHLQQKKAASPEALTKNIKSISSFLENFSKMMTNLSTKVGTLANQIDGIKEKLNTVQSKVT